MKKYNADEIVLLLKEFDDVFPGNKEKIADYEEWARKICNNGMVLMLTQEGKNIGLSVFYANDVINRIGYISLIGIKEEYRSKGWGEGLLSATIESMRKNGMKKCRLEVDKDNYKALRFYSRNGFIRENENKNSFLLCKGIGQTKGLE